MVDHHYALSELHHNISLGEKLRHIHHYLHGNTPILDRIAVVIYDPKTDLLKTFIHSSGADDPLSNYQARLADVPSLQEIHRSGLPRLVNDISALYRAPHKHSRKITAQGYGSSYTLPMTLHGTFFGFVFFNSYKKHAFTEAVLTTLDLYSHMISCMVVNELTVIHTMLGAIKTARDMTTHRDVETGAHLERMSRYARLIAKEVALQHDLDDEYIEHLFLFAPLHDVGKIGVPDNILLKRDQLSTEEFQIMKNHATKGREIVDTLLAEFSLSGLPYVDVLRNIVELHHEKMDASGYPHGLGGNDIPLEARIVAVADIFDALTSVRPYKMAWSNEEAFMLLRVLAANKLDPDCVQALIHNSDKVKQIQTQFHNTTNTTPTHQIHAST